MSQRYSDRETLMKVLDSLEHRYPGSVALDESTGTATLTGWVLEQFNDTQGDENGADNIECDPRRACRSRVSGDLTTGATKDAGNQDFLVRVIDPLTNTPQSTAERDKSGCGGWVCTEQPGSVNQEHKESACNKYFVPVVKRKFSDRVFHVLSRLMFWRG